METEKFIALSQLDIDSLISKVKTQYKGKLLPSKGSAVCIRCDGVLDNKAEECMNCQKCVVCTGC